MCIRDRGTAAVLHRNAGWVRPARLVAAWLATPGVSFAGGQPVARIVPHGQRWRLLDAAGRLLAEADRVVAVSYTHLTLPTKRT